ncbi:SDR family oxidoreductase [Empedobacter brevis]|uniref:NAD-dependent epimerase/dehydratase family protein n=1 Tax=Empedobacter brevis TaxID=247 RepID=UPI002FE36A32
MKKVLVIGANSFLSNAIAKEYSYNNIDAIYYSAPSSDFNKNYSINDLEKITEHYDIVFIVSSFISNDLSSIDKILDINVRDLNRIVQKFIKSRIIFCSSVSVYDAIESGVIDDLTKASPISIYGTSKLFGENIIKQHFNYGIIRISSMYGVGMKNITFLPKIIDNAITKKVIDLIGDGSRKQNYIHVKDVAQIAKKLGEKDFENKTVLAVNPYNYSNIEVAGNIKSITNCDIIFTGNDKTRSVDYETKNELVIHHDFIGLKEGLKELVEWKKRKF